MGKPQEAYTGINELEFLRLIGPHVIEYSTWYAENGRYLPPEYATDPSGWTEVLRDMERAFELVTFDVDTLDERDLTLFDKGVSQFYKYSNQLWK